MPRLYDVPADETRAHRDFGLTVLGPAPLDYPRQLEADTFNATCFLAEYPARRAAYMDYVRRNPAPPTFKAPYFELARLAAGGVPHEGILLGACGYVDQRKDCSDFVLHALLRLLYQFNVHPSLSPHLYEQVYASVIHFKYWPDEPGEDSMCTWTENHQILFASAAYLAGQLFPEEVFANARHSGAEKMALARPRILRWLGLRARTGFSEWLSNVYYDEDLTALVNLLDFCEDEEIRAKARQVIDLLLLDLALNSFRGVFGSTHGRSYAIAKMYAQEEATSPVSKLLFGLGSFSSADSMSAACFALSPAYQLPEWIFKIANDIEAVVENRQRMGLRLSEAGRWGLGFESFEDGMVYLSLEAYAHPRSLDLILRMFDAWNWWSNGYFKPFARMRKELSLLRKLRLTPWLARLLDRDINRNTREEANLYTYRTPDGMLSCAQDYRKGYGGDQQSIWQATLGPGAVCFTTHPAKRQGDSPNYWTGSGSLPRAAQYKNVLAVVYRISTAPGLYQTNQLRFTHAWLPRLQFDEVVERGGWIFARKGEGYLALRSQHAWHWESQEPGGEPDEVVSDGLNNIWLCEMGRKAEAGTFEQFIQRICTVPLAFRGPRVRYESPSVGRFEFGWNGPLRVGGKEIPLRDYPRYENPYIHLPFGEDPVLPRGYDKL